jgi:zinc protease
MRTKLSVLSLILLLALSTLLPALAGAQDLAPIKYEKFTLPNGLQVILHEDHTIPMAAVNLWYRVGSKNEKPGRTGFAHIFEHMMFQGSQHADADYFQPLESIGGEINGSTSEDRTNYWENVPSDQLERALWMEADRMGYLLPAMTEAKLGNQKDVVKNEKRQGENQPYAVAEELLLQMQYPAEHPYRHTVIGSMEDLSAASLDDVKDFFRTYYAPNNASLCIAGDIDPVKTRALVEKYFASIPSGPPVQRLTAWSPPIVGIRRGVAQDKVELPKIYMVWRSPGAFQPGDADLDLASQVLAGGKTSRLYKSLVYEKQVAQDVNAYQYSKELNGEFTVEVTARAGQDLDQLEAMIDAELRTLATKGATQQELDLARTDYETNFVRRLERIGGFGGKADLLNSYNVRAGEPDYFRQDLQRYRVATVRSVREAAATYLDLGNRVILRVVPQGTLTAGEAPADLAKMPESSGPVSFRAPQIQTATLSNGLKVYLVERHGLPIVQVDLNILSGGSADPAGKPGAASLTAALLDEGTTTRNAMQISTRTQELGARLTTGSSFDASSASLNILKRDLDAGLELLSDVVVHPTFPSEELERQRKIYLGRIQEEMSDPSSLAFRAMQRRIFGAGHPYAQPFSGNGTAASIQALTRDDLVRFHQAYYVPNNAAALVAGDITLAEATARLEKALGGWKRGEVTALSVPAPKPSSTARVLIVDRPGAQQSYVVAAHLGMPRRDPECLPFEVMNTILGSYFSARVNMNLREDKGYTYGAYTFPINLRDGGVFACTAPVHTKFTKESVVELLKELRGIGSDRPATETELATAKKRLIQGYPQEFETIRGIEGQLAEVVVYSLPLDEWTTRMGRIEAIDAAAVQQAAKKDVRPDDLVFVIVGDRAVIEEGIKSLDLGQIEVVDAAAL